jgi:hypothetical protein
LVNKIRVQLFSVRKPAGLSLSKGLGQPSRVCAGRDNSKKRKLLTVIEGKKAKEFPKTIIHLEYFE